MFGSMLQDVRFGMRTLVRAPAFALAAIATVAIGVGATTAMFGVVDGILLRPLPYHGAGMLVQIGLQLDSYAARVVSPTDYFDLSARSRTLAAVAVSRLESKDVGGGPEPKSVLAAGVSATFFDVLGVPPALGRAFRAADDTRAAEAIVVLSHGFWQAHFGGDPGILGRVLTLDEQPYVVAGVMPSGFRGPEAIFHNDVLMWFPLGRIADPLDVRADAFMQMIGRARPGVALAALGEELRVVAAQLNAEYPEGEKSYWVADLRERTIGGAGRLLWLLLGAVALLLLIACANVANLLLVRATDRARELAVRAALGAGRARVARQLLTESVLLGLVGGAVGALVAAAGVRVFRAFAPAELPRLAEIAVDLRVLAFALTVSIATGILFGLAPVIEAARGQVAGRLREAALGNSGGARSQRMRGVFVALQTSVALVLLMGAALLINGFVRLSTIDAGFDVEDVVWLNVSLPARRYESAAARQAFFERALEQVRALPGVREAGAIHGTPLDGNNSRTSVLPEGAAPANGEAALDVSFHSVLPGYFSALGIRLLEGRDVSSLDRTGSTPVAVVSEKFARHLWPGERALGKRFRFAENEDASFITVIGIAADVRHYGLAQDPEPMMYLPFAHFPRTWLGIAVKHEGAAAPLLGAMRAAIWTLDPALPLDAFGTMRERVSTSLGSQRFRTYLLSAFAAVALLLTFVGLYGTMAHLVRARRREMGIRLALGAAARDVRAMVVGRGMRIAAVGILLGTVAAFAATRLLASFVFGVSTTDPLTFAAGIAFMAATAFLACWLPARRAATIDPARTLRAE